MSTKRDCCIKECTNKRVVKGICAFHYGRWQNGIELDAPKGNPKRRGKCKVDGCESAVDVIKSEMCFFHYQRARNHVPLDAPKQMKSKGKSCLICGKKPVLAKQLCSRHYYQKYQGGKTGLTHNLLSI